MPSIYKNKKKYGGGSAPGPEYTAGNGIVIENDEISVDEMSAEDMSEIVTPKPSVKARYQKYSTEEQVVGEWIDGKPIYQRVLTGNLAVVSTEGTTTVTEVPLNVPISKFIDVNAVVIENGDSYRTATSLNYTNDSLSGVFRYSAYSDGAQGGVANSIRLRCSILGCSEAPYFVIVQYTKTTD